MTYMSSTWRLAALFSVAALLMQTSAAAPPPAIPFVCSLNRIQCPSKIQECISPMELCNGIVNCPDGSDENATFCKAYNCSGQDPPTNSPYAYVGWTEDRVNLNRKCPSGKMCTMGPVRYTDNVGILFTPWLCDGVKHCADGSDEDVLYCQKLHQSMAAKNCSIDTPGVYDTLGVYDVFMHGYYSDFNSIRDAVSICPSKSRCMLKEHLCDFKKDCPDGSDEGPSACKNVTCPDLRHMAVPFRCKNLACLTSENYLCDGVDNCGDGSDEDPAYCTVYNCPRTGGKKCSNNRTCIADEQVCDGKWNCPAGTDERPSFCRYYKCYRWMKKCPNGIRCYHPEHGIGSCLTQSPSPPPPPPSPPPLPPKPQNCSLTLELNCPTGGGCIYEQYLCDGKKDCRDGSDEGEFCKTYNCSKSCRCGTPNCIHPDSDFPPPDPPYRQPIMCKKDWTCVCGGLCNGWVECDDKSDEDPAFCSTYKCPPGSQKCPNYPYQCIEEDRLCDRKKHCIRGGDEDYSFCRGRCRGGWARALCQNKTYHCLPNDRNSCHDYAQCVHGGAEAVPNCKTVECTSIEMKFPYGNNSYQCVYKWNVCDGRVHAIDGRDEDPAFCKSFKCEKYFVKCPNNPYQCIFEDHLCDGTKQCVNGGDEDPSFCRGRCPGGTSRALCQNKTYRCIPNKFWQCKESAQCVHGGAEAVQDCKTVECTPNEMKIPYGNNSYQCVSYSYICDGRVHAIDGRDEDPAFCKSFKCNYDAVKCPNSRTYQCVKTRLLCDGKKDCLKDGADENPAFCNNFTRPT